MYTFYLYLKSKDRPVASLSYPVPHHVIHLIIPIMETNLAIACIVIVRFVGGPAIADRSYPSAGSPALRILSGDVAIRRLLSSTMKMSFRYHSIRTNHNVVFWIKDTKKFSINISNLFLISDQYLKYRKLS